MNTSNELLLSIINSKKDELLKKKNETVYFNGYNNGYITISNDNMYITIITKDYNYLITIHNLEYFTKDKVISMISSIEIK